MNTIVGFFLSCIKKGNIKNKFLIRTLIAIYRVMIKMDVTCSKKLECDYKIPYNREKISYDIVLKVLKNNTFVFTDIDSQSFGKSIGVIDKNIQELLCVLPCMQYKAITFESHDGFRVTTKITKRLVQVLKERSWFVICLGEIKLKVFVWRYGYGNYLADPEVRLFAPSRQVISRCIRPESVNDNVLPKQGFVKLSSLYKKRILTRTPFEIDIVYTWVNNNDDEWQKLLASCTDAPVRKELYLNSNELKYSMRSVHQHMPWVHKIYILSNCAPPDWLLLSTNIEWVYHQDIFADEHLPCFNSHVIGSYIGNIQGLADHFIYFNDDAFVSRALPPEYFFTPNDCSVSYMGSSIIQSFFGKESRDYLKAAVNSRRLIEESYNISAHMQHEHTPSAICKKVFLSMIDEFSKEFFEFRKNTFRADSDLSAVAFMYHNYAFIKRRTIFSQVNCKHRLIQENNYKKFTDINPEYFDFIGLNDGGHSSSNTDFQNFKQRFMEQHFKKPSPWEKK